MALNNPLTQGQSNARPLKVLPCIKPLEYQENLPREFLVDPYAVIFKDDFNILHTRVKRSEILYLHSRQRPAGNIY